MGKHSKDWNTTPVDPKADAQQKADEFDKQYEQNQRTEETEENE